MSKKANQLNKTNKALQKYFALDKEILFYLSKTSFKQKVIILTVVKALALETLDKQHVKEMNRRFKELETGSVKGYSFTDIGAKAREAFGLKKAGKK